MSLTPLNLFVFKHTANTFSTERQLKKPGGCSLSFFSCPCSFNLSVSLNITSLPLISILHLVSPSSPFLFLPILPTFSLSFPVHLKDSLTIALSSICLSVCPPHCEYLCMLYVCFYVLQVCSNATNEGSSFNPILP